MTTQSITAGAPPSQQLTELIVRDEDGQLIFSTYKCPACVHNKYIPFTNFEGSEVFSTTHMFKLSDEFYKCMACGFTLTRRLDS